MTTERRAQILKEVSMSRQADWTCNYSMNAKEVVRANPHPQNPRGNEADAKAISPMTAQTSKAISYSSSLRSFPQKTFAYMRRFHLKN